MSTKLDFYDRNLLYELDKDSSQPISKLAKKLRRSKQFVLYRMKKLEETGIITGYQAIIDMSKIGYFTFRIYFKFQKMTREDGEKFVAHIRENLDQVWTITSMHGKWDYALFLGVNSINELHGAWDNIMLHYKEKIKSYNISVYSPIHNFNRKFFLNHTKRKIETVERIYGAEEKEKIEEKDWKLIKAYAIDVRKSSLDLAKKLNLSPETVRKRIKNLEKRKIIVGYKLGLDTDNLGYDTYRIDLHLSSTKQNKKLFNYCKSHKNIYQINNSIGGADFEIEIGVNDFFHMVKLIDEIKKEFKDVVNDADHFGFSTFHVLKYIPD